LHHFGSHPELNKARRKRLFVNHNLTEDELTDPNALRRFSDGYVIFKRLSPSFVGGYQPRYRNILAKVYLGTSLIDRELDIEEKLVRVEALWREVLNQVIDQKPRFVVKTVDQATGLDSVHVAQDKWVASDEFEGEIRSFVRTGNIRTLRENCGG
jgi:hypothetical protein